LSFELHFGSETFKCIPDGWKNNTESISATDEQDVGWPEFEALVDSIAWIRKRAAISRSDWKFDEENKRFRDLIIFIHMNHLMESLLARINKVRDFKVYCLIEFF
jgi:hypothetical protein